MDEAVRKLSSFPSLGIGIRGVNEQFLVIRNLLEQGDTKIPPVLLELALSNIESVQYEPNSTVDLGGFELIIIAIHRLKTLFPTQKLNMINSLNRIINLTIAAGLPLPTPPATSLPPSTPAPPLAPSIKSNFSANRPAATNSTSTSLIGPPASSSTTQNPSKPPQVSKPKSQKRKLESTELESGSDDPDKPRVTYANLIGHAILESKDKKLRLSEIYASISKRFAFYQKANIHGWQNSIRHNLSISDSFAKSEIAVPGLKGYFWIVVFPGSWSLKNGSWEENRKNKVKGPNKSNTTSPLIKSIPASARPSASIPAPPSAPASPIGSAWSELATEAILAIPDSTTSDIAQFIVKKYPAHSNLDVVIKNLDAILNRSRQFRKSFRPEVDNQTIWSLAGFRNYTGMEMEEEELEEELRLEANRRKAVDFMATDRAYQPGQTFKTQFLSSNSTRRVSGPSGVVTPIIDELNNPDAVLDEPIRKKLKLQTRSTESATEPAISPPLPPLPVDPVVPSIPVASSSTIQAPPIKIQPQLIAEAVVSTPSGLKPDNNGSNRESLIVKLSIPSKQERIIEKVVEKAPEISNLPKRPEVTWVNLVMDALLEKPQRAMNAEEISKSIMANYIYFQGLGMHRVQHACIRAIREHSELFDCHAGSLAKNPKEKRWKIRLDREEEEERPTISWIDLITEALLRSPDHCATSSALISGILSKYSYSLDGKCAELVRINVGSCLNKFRHFKVVDGGRWTFIEKRGEESEKVKSRPKDSVIPTPVSKPIQELGQEFHSSQQALPKPPASVPRPKSISFSPSIAQAILSTSEKHYPASTRAVGDWKSKVNNTLSGDPNFHRLPGTYLYRIQSKNKRGSAKDGIIKAKIQPSGLDSKNRSFSGPARDQISPPVSRVPSPSSNTLPPLEEAPKLPISKTLITSKPVYKPVPPPPSVTQKSNHRPAILSNLGQVILPIKLPFPQSIVPITLSKEVRAALTLRNTPYRPFSDVRVIVKTNRMEE